MSLNQRLTVLGVALVASIGALIFQLWSVQVTSAQEYREQAANNQVKVVETPAPRGEIRDRYGRLLATSTPVLVAVIDGAVLPGDHHAFTSEVIQRLSAWSGLSPAEVEQAYERARSSGDRVVLVSDLEEDQALQLIEYQEQFVGVEVLAEPLRVYPYGSTGGGVLGYVGDPNESDLARPDVGATDTVGRAGVEREYDDQLRGEPGRTFVRVDAARNSLGVLEERLPAAGSNLELTIDIELQQALEESLEQGLAAARARYGHPDCDPLDDPACPVRAVGVVLDATDGSVVAMSSAPGFDPNVFVDGVSESEWERLSSLALFNNFVIQGLYPPASAFKTVAYVMALEEGIFPEEATEQSAEGLYNCTGQLSFPFNDGSQQVFRDWLPQGHGPVNLQTALETSCDLYFWQIALNVWTNRMRDDGTGSIPEDLIQQWARTIGFGQETGIDLPFEGHGLIPDRAWFERAQRETPARVRDGPWTGGDVMNTVVGQGSVLVTPLQLANAYAALVNGGTLWRPRVVDRITDANGEVKWENTPAVLNEIAISRETVVSLRRDLYEVVNGDRGTARSAFAAFGPGVETIGGKTGTAEIIKGTTADGDVDTALFVGITPVSAPKYVVAVVVERGGSGGAIAAPTARRVLQYLVNGETGMTPVAPGDNAD